jgi:hypothetical protein
MPERFMMAPPQYGMAGKIRRLAARLVDDEDQIAPTANQLAGQPHEVRRVYLLFCDSAAGFARPLDGLYHLAASHDICEGQEVERLSLGPQRAAVTT